MCKPGDETVRGQMPWEAGSGDKAARAIHGGVIKAQASPDHAAPAGVEHPALGLRPWAASGAAVARRAATT